MTMQKLTLEQKKILRFRIRRNALVSKLMTDNPQMLSYEALKLANKMLRSEGGSK